LVIDTETLTDTSQALTFGSAQLVQIKWRKQQGGTYAREDHHIEAEVLFHNDSLETSDPAGYAILTKYGKDNDVPVIKRSVFMDRYFRYYCERRRGPNGTGTLGTATAVFFNAPFDVSRLAEDFGNARGRNAGAFSFRMWPLHDGAENRYRRRIIVRHLDSKKSLISYGTSLNATPNSGDADTETGSEHVGHGQFLDLRQLIWGMTNDATSLARACELFNLPDEHRKTRPLSHGEITPDYIDYNRQDVTATAELAVIVLGEYFRHPIDVQPSKVFSPASIAKAYLRKMGIPPMLDRGGFPSDPVTLGNSISTFYGGRAECHIRKTPVPVQVCDFTSMYPTVNALMGLWGYITAESLSVVDATGDIRDLIDNATVERMLDPNVWPSFVGMVQIIPDGDTLPVRAAYADEPGNYNVGLNRLHSKEPLWFTIPDVMASALLTGRTPRILRAVRFVPSDTKQSGLRPVELLGRVHVDPTKTDFFKSVVEQRQAIKKERGPHHPDTCSCERCRTERFLKVLANAGSYGIFVEMMRTDADKPRASTVYGAYDKPWQTTTKAEEEAQEFCYPPIGAAITGAARLMLAILEKLVTDAGGTWLFCDTDSMAIVANEAGSLVPCTGGPHTMPDGGDAVRALTYDQVGQIREAVNRLNPYDRDKVPDILKVEATCHGFMISAKRYTLFNYDGTGIPVVPEKIDGKEAYSRHGLGMYLDPGDPESGRHEWIRQTWQYILDNAHHMNPDNPSWFNQPAMTLVSVSSPHVMRSLETLNAGKSYDDKVKPFNFVLLTSEGGLQPMMEGSARRRFIAPYTKDPAAWQSQEWDWHNIYDPDADPIPGSEFPFMRMQRIVRGYNGHPESKALGPDGRPCSVGTIGQLQPRTVRVQRLTHIGKESNKLEEVRDQMYSHWSDVLTEYRRDDVSDVVAVIDLHARREFAGLVNAESDSIRQKIRDAEIAARRESGNTLRGLTGNTRVTALTTNITSRIEDVERMCGLPVSVDHKLIARFVSGARVSSSHRHAIVRTAAKRVAPTVGIDPDNIMSAQTHGSVSAELVLRLWSDSGRPLVGEAVPCLCGCGKTAPRRSRYANAACRQRHNRANRTRPTVRPPERE
jgi:hypothetical protein